MGTKYFPTNLKFLRKNIGISQADIALQLDKRSTAISSWENGLSEPGIADLYKISNIFGIYVGDLIGKDLSSVLVHTAVVAKEESIVQPVEKLYPVYNEDNNKLSMASDYETKYERTPFGSSYVPKVVTVDSNGQENMVFVPVKARAGYLSGYGDQEFIQNLPAYRLPGYSNGTFRMFEVAGLSMYPTFNDRDIIIAKFVESLDSIRDDRVYTVVTKEGGIVVKRVLNRIATDKKLILKSDNVKDKAEYPNMVVDPSDILELWYCVAYISRVMRNPSEMYTRVIDLEGRLTLMEERMKKQY
ncbi:helix-turn-helix domain-containing protein [Parasediminibacterium sp. JCM 36343]|uniref:helix-turn-helix domain-containing protein n=1 Tax=Parasediminibacterium sp. JCM 36343 TaxID=3374279 RepID=UPI00397B24AC